MRLIVQRVSRASVAVKESNKIAGIINNGLFVLVGIKKGDRVEDANVLAEKLAKLRVMADHNAKMNLASDNFLIVSQFTLYADASSGNRPSFINAADPIEAKKLYEHFIARLKELGKKVETGSFGDYMEIKAELDGPVTIILES